jgi:hypothetical protein
VISAIPCSKKWCAPPDGLEELRTVLAVLVTTVGVELVRGKTSKRDGCVEHECGSECLGEGHRRVGLFVHDLRLIDRLLRVDVVSEDVPRVLEDDLLPCRRLPHFRELRRAGVRVVLKSHLPDVSVRMLRAASRQR